MRVIVGADDEGEVLDAVLAYLKDARADIELLQQSAWPHVAGKVGEGVASKRADFGIVMCWTGTGTSMAANKIKGVRAALCWDPWIATGARRWNDANVLVLSLKRTTAEEAVKILEAWLSVQSPDEDEAGNIALLAELEGR